MKFSIYDSSGWIGDAYSSEGGGGGNFIDWLWKTFCISMMIGGVEYIPLYVFTEMIGVNYTVLHPGQPDSGNFFSKALVYGAFVFGSFFMTTKNKKLIIVLISTCIINLGYCCAYESLGKVLMPFTWLVSVIFIALGVIPAYITEHLIGIDTSLAVMWVSGLMFGITLGVLYSLIFHKQFAWYNYWD